jgi:hypothetical protein
MFIKTKILLAAAILANTAIIASAQTSHRRATHPRALYDRAMVAPGSFRINSDSPAATGGGSIGYNQNIYNW